ncbi:helix-turn-helix DNA binding domain protein [Mycobacterium phage MyraDee]|uniref:Helix-turn-helix DNA binding domain protein n=1 Tax=Mycobacterium phage MyraDee TaxID=2024303 RepID=A0A222YY13_9CAUD|nr:helix-turn-helix DNA binding domain protein [Mycobacterium phage MyraDee]ASR77169.1 helix-turn-helix DNA binding domain protein [Mycobacterium phage MyraDee]
MSVQDTSIESYYKSLDSIPETERDVFRALSILGALCNREISDLIDRPINEVTPVVFRLRERGLVIESHRAKYAPTNRRVIYWKAVP